MEKCWKMSAYGFFFLLTFLTSLKPSIQQPKLEYVGYVCPQGKHTYLKNSTYSSNLKSLLLYLSSNDSFLSSNGFQSLPLRQNPDMVFALSLCRGDLSPEVCRDCVKTAGKDILHQCPNGKEALIYYDECMLRYADRNLLLDPVTTTGQLMENQNSVMANQSVRFSKVLLSLMNELAEEVASSPRKFAFKKENYSTSQTVYVLGQCTPDLTKENCSSCLQQAVKKMPRDKIGARLLWPSCNLRYATNLFYNETSKDTPTSPLLTGKGENTIVKIIAIVLPLALSALLFVA